MSDEQTTGEQVLSGISMVVFMMMLCTTALCLTIYHSAEKIDLDVIYKIDEHLLKKGGGK